MNTINQSPESIGNSPKDSKWHFVLGLVLCFFGFVNLFIHFKSAIFLIIAGVLLTPHFSKKIKEKYNYIFSKKTKSFLVIGLILLSFISWNKKEEISQLPVIADSNVQNAVKDIPYEVIESWEIPNGGFGKIIVISPTNANESDVIALGEKLRKETKNDRNSSIDIFSDKQAALLRKKVIGQKATEAEDKLYGTHFIASYSKNINTGYHKLEIHLTGIDEKNWKQISY